MAEDRPDRIDVAERTTRWRRRLVLDRTCTVVAELVRPPRPIVGLATWRPSHGPPEPGLPVLELASRYVVRVLSGTGLAGELLERALGCAPARF